ncbi:hypothetical protein CpecF_0941 [Chlamydia pecorum DBDeUG]|nr:hypothetical protein CpecF_0941 [Chlamydia pecorum DBDeUG]
MCFQRDFFAVFLCGKEVTLRIVVARFFSDFIVSWRSKSLDVNSLL